MYSELVKGTAGIVMVGGEDIPAAAKKRGRPGKSSSSSLRPIDKGVGSKKGEGGSNGAGNANGTGEEDSACVPPAAAGHKRGRGRPATKKKATTPLTNGFTPINATPSSACEADDEDSDAKRVKLEHGDEEEEGKAGEFDDAMVEREEEVV